MKCTICVFVIVFILYIACINVNIEALDININIEINNDDQAQETLHHTNQQFQSEHPAHILLQGFMNDKDLDRYGYIQDAVNISNSNPTYYEIGKLNRYELSRPEGIRHYYVYIPKSYSSAEKNIWPVINMYHGFGGTCEQQLNGFNWLEAAENHKFIFVFPCGTYGQHDIYAGNNAYAYGWNSGLCCNVNHPGLDDVTFIELIQTNVNSLLSTDITRHFIAGFSNGGHITEYFSCYRPDIFSAAASASGSTLLSPGKLGGLSSCDTVFSKYNTQLSMLHFHGTADKTVDWNGDYIKPSATEDVQGWAKRNGCDINKSIIQWEKPPYKSVIWENCSSINKIETQSNHAVEFVIKDQGGHTWNQDNIIDTTEYIIQFFKTHGRNPL